METNYKRNIIQPTLKNSAIERGNRWVSGKRKAFPVFWQANHGDTKVQRV